MAVDRRQGKRDLAAKLKFERRLRRELRTVGDRAARRFTRLLGTSGRVAPVGDDVAKILERILRDHYDLVAAEFSTRLTEQMPPDIAVTEEERAEIDHRLDEAFEVRARRQAKFIGDTTQADARFAREIAQEAAAGQNVSRQEFAAIAGTALMRKMRGRENQRAIVETQAPAELSKQVEAEVLTGVSVFEEKARAKKVAMKEWVSQGDDLVRPWHLEADSKQVFLKDPFTVMGQKLMFPGDQSLGATLPNIIGCRCSSVTDPASVFIDRRKEIIPPPKPPKPKKKAPAKKKPAKKAPAKKKPPEPKPAAQADDVAAREKLLNDEGLTAFADMESIPGVSAWRDDFPQIKAQWNEAIASIKRSVQSNQMPDQNLVKRLYYLAENFEYESAAQRVIVRDAAEWGMREAQQRAFKEGIKPPTGKWQFNHFNFELDDALATARSELEELGYTRDLLRRRSRTAAGARDLAEDIKGSLRLMNEQNDVRRVVEGSIADKMRFDASVGKGLRGRISGVMDDIVDSEMAAANLVDEGGFMKDIWWQAKSGERAWANKQSNAIMLATTERQGVIAHEFGHHIEYRNDLVRERIMQWRKGRTIAKGEQPSVIYKNHPDETGYRDGFYAHYVGKVYRTGHTEVLSMGLETFFNPAAMKKMMGKDPEHFELMWSILRGY